VSTPFRLELKIHGLPKMSNALLRSGWKAKHGHARQWKRRVWAVAWPYRPAKPLDRVKLTLTRCSSSEPDADGLVSGFKSVIDGLVEAGILVNDRPANIGFPDYRWEYCVKGKGHLIIVVESN